MTQLTALLISIIVFLFVFIVLFVILTNTDGNTPTSLLAKESNDHNSTLSGTHTSPSPFIKAEGFPKQEIEAHYDSVNIEDEETVKYHIDSLVEEEYNAMERMIKENIVHNETVEDIPPYLPVLNSEDLLPTEKELEIVEESINAEDLISNTNAFTHTHDDIIDDSLNDTNADILKYFTDHNNDS